MHETWDPERLLRSCDHTQRHTDATRDLLTEPGWTEWEGVAENAPLDARDRMLPPDAREVRVPVHTARPEPAACVAFWCLLACAVLGVVGMVARGLGAF